MPNLLFIIHMILKPFLVLFCHKVGLVNIFTGDSDSCITWFTLVVRNDKTIRSIGGVIGAINSIITSNSSQLTNQFFREGSVINLKVRILFWLLEVFIMYVYIVSMLSSSVVKLKV